MMDRSRISACSYPIRVRPLDEIFGIIRDAGYLKVDLWGGPPHYTHDPPCDVPALKARAAAYGLTIANLGTYPGRRFHEVGYEAEMAEMRRAIDNAAMLGCRSIRVCPGDGEDPSIVAELIPFFTKSASYAETRGVRLGMENHRGSIAADPLAVMPLVHAVDSAFFGILYEPANLMACRIDYRDAYHAFRGHIVHVHVKDSRWVGDRYERTMLGDGEVDIEWMVGALEADGYDGDYALEFEIEQTVPVHEGLPVWLDVFSRVGS